MAANFADQWHRKLCVSGRRAALACIDFFLVLQDAAAVVPYFLRCSQPDLPDLALSRTRSVYDAEQNIHTPLLQRPLVRPPFSAIERFTPTGRRHANLREALPSFQHPET